MKNYQINKLEKERKNIQKTIIILIAIIILQLTLFSNLIFAQDLNQNLTGLNSYDYIKLNITNNIEFKINFDSNYKINFFNLYSYFLPQTINNSQYLNQFKTSNNNYHILKNEYNSSYLNYYYNKNNLKQSNQIQNSFLLQSVKTQSHIKNKIIYPIKNLDKKYNKYLQFYDFINTNQDIKNQAAKIAYGEDDLFLISAKIAKWIQEDITYDLKTALQNPNQKSSDVFKSKFGVCREITNLYVSMIRSLGIPARVITGYSYTNSDELVKYLNSNWGGHAWAEVLIGDKWIPFDLTYNQYGYVDATHLIFEKSKLSTSTNLRINASGYGFSIVPNSLKMNNKFEVINKIKNTQEESKFNQYQINLSGPNQLGFGSYGYIKVDIKNNIDEYRVLFLNFVKTKDTELLDSNKKMIILKPNQKKTIYFHYKLPENLDNNYIYTYPFSIQNEFIKKDFNITLKEEYPKIKEIGLPKNTEEKKSYSNNKLITNCNFIIEENQNNILCSIKNPNNYQINNIQICLENKDTNIENKNNCKKIDLNINDIKSINLNTKKFSNNLTTIYSHLINKTSKIETEKINLIIKKPKLEFKFNNKTNQIIYSISNYINGTQIIILNNKNNKTITNSKKEKKKLFLDLKPGKYQLDIKLKIKNQTLEKNKLNITIKDLSNYKKAIIKENKNEKELSFWEKFLIWLKEFLTYRK